MQMEGEKYLHVLSSINSAFYSSEVENLVWDSLK